MPAAPTIENRHQGYPEWLDRAITHYSAMTTAALAERLRDETGRNTGWDNDERDVIVGLLENRHPEIDAATRHYWNTANPHASAATRAAVTCVVLTAIDALPTEDA